MITGHSLALIFLSSAIIFSYAYCLDLFQALQVHFREEPYNFSTLEFNLMYFFTYLPIFLFNIPIGMIIDRSSVKKSMFVLLFMNLCSQIVCTIMVVTRTSGYIIIMYIMRSMFGLAGEGMFTVQGLIITKYCKNNFEIVMSIALGLPFVFDSLNSLVTTRVYDYTQTMVWPWSIGIIISVISVLSGFVLYFLIIRKGQRKNQQLSLLEVQASENQQIKNENVEQQSSFNIKQLRMMPRMFWILMVASFFSEISLGGFMDNLNDLLVKRFNIPYTDAGALLIIPYSGLTLFSIVFSVLITKKPHIRRNTFLISNLLYALGQVFLYLLPQTENPSALYYVTICFFTTTISFNFSIYYTAILAVLPQIVPRQAVGTAYGVVGSIVGLSQCLGPFMNIAIIDSDSDHLLCDSKVFIQISFLLTIIWENSVRSATYENLSLNLAYIIISSIAVLLALYIRIGPYDSLDSDIQDKPQQPQGQYRILSQQK